MKLVLTHPFCWPYLRRGTERNIENLFQYFANQTKHEVSLLSTKPPGPDIAPVSKGRRLLTAGWWRPEMSLLRLGPEHVFGLSTYWRLRDLEADVVHSFFYTDSLAASSLRRRKKWRTILQLNGIAIPGLNCRRIPPEAWMLQRAIREADEFVVCSSFIAEQAEKHYGRRPRVLPPPIVSDAWPMGEERTAKAPVILGVGDFDVRRKGIRVLLRAFERFRLTHSDAVLKISGKLTIASIQDVLDELSVACRSAIQFLGLGQPGDLPALYQEANMLVLPAMWEPSGTVMFESLASGTPVVAARHAGLPEFLTEDVGVLFDPESEGEETHNVSGLCQAMEMAFALSMRPGNRSVCRVHALKYSTDSIGSIWENIYRGL